MKKYPMINGKETIKTNSEFVTVGELMNFIKENELSEDSLIWIDFGQGDGTFLRKEVKGNFKSNKGLTFEENTEYDTIKIHLSPICLKWHEVDTLYPVVLSVDKTHI